MTRAIGTFFLAKDFVKQPIVTLRGSSDSVAADAKQQKIDTARPCQLVDKITGLLDRGKKTVDTHLRLLETDRIPDIEGPVANRESVWLERHSTTMAVW